MLLLQVGAEQLRALVAHYGYGAVAAGVLLENLGVPVPGDTMVLVAAAAAQQGILRVPLVVAVATVAAMVGDNLGFELGRKLGRPQLTHHFPRLFTPDRLASADRFFQRRGAVAVAVARFIPGIRVVAAIAAGTSSFDRRSFIIANAIGALAWASWATFLGYTGWGLGERAFAWLDHGHRTIWVVAVVALVSGTAVALLRRKHAGGRDLPHP